MSRLCKFCLFDHHTVFMSHVNIHTPVPVKPRRGFGESSERIFISPVGITAREDSVASLIHNHLASMRLWWGKAFLSLYGTARLRSVIGMVALAMSGSQFSVICVGGIFFWFRCVIVSLPIFRSGNCGCRYGCVGDLASGRWWVVWV